jgi:hypothetical protein
MTSHDESHDDALRAAVALAFLVLGVWCVVVAVAAAEVPVPGLVVLVVSGPVLAVLEGLHAYWSLREEGGGR